MPSVTHKKCSKCHIDKPIEDFYKRLARKNGNSCCKKCWSEKRKYLRRNDKKYRKKEITRAKQYNKINKERIKKRQSEYCKKNRYKINCYLIKRKKNDIEFKTLCLLKTRIVNAVKQQGTKKSYKSAELLGCSVPELMKHLESQFDNRMTWDNHGKFGWHIDHIIPCAAFDLTKPEEQKKCFHYSNLQPLWAADNYKKTSWHNNKLIRKKT